MVKTCGFIPLGYSVSKSKMMNAQIIISCLLLSQSHPKKVLVEPSPMIQDSVILRVLVQDFKHTVRVVKNCGSHTAVFPHFPHSDEETAKRWLQSLQSSIPRHGQVLNHVTLMLSALLCTSKGCVTMEALKVIPVVAKTDSSQVQSNFKIT